MKQDKDANEDVYGKPTDAKEILTGTVSVPGSAKSFVSTTARYTKRAS